MADELGAILSEAEDRVLSANRRRERIKAAAAAIANARGGRRGMPPITNILDMLPDKLVAEVMEDAEAALTAAGVQ